MDSVDVEFKGASWDELETLYDEIEQLECECPVRRATRLCSFHNKLSRINQLQNNEIDLILDGLHKVRSVISKSLPVLEEIDASFDDVLK